jgi:hypothetical protein
MRSRILALAILVAAFSPAIAGAATIPVGTTVAITTSIGTTQLGGFGTASDLGEGEIGWTLNDVNGGNAGVWGQGGIIRIDSWQASLKTDPFVTNNLNVTNTSSVAQTFTATVTLPIAGGFAYNQIIDSSIGITITDSITSLGGVAGDGATISSVAPNGIYRGLINGVTALTLFPNPSTISCAADGCSITSSDPLSGDFDGPAGPGIATSIAITLQFTLGAGDSAGITSRFEIVPEPGTLALFASGLAGMSLLGRRRA